MARLRGGAPDIWVTSFSRLLADEHECEWASWFRAHHVPYTWEEVRDPSFDRAQWRADHDALVVEERDRLRAQGFIVSREEKFTLRGKPGPHGKPLLGGRPDLLSIKDNALTVTDCKTGTPRLSDEMQVLTYMWALPRAVKRYSGMEISGRLVYTDHELPIPAERLDDAFSERLTSLLQRIASPEPATRVPSAFECGWCPIPADECPDRFTFEDNVGETDEF